MKYAFQEFGQHEVPGNTDNPRVQQYLSTCGLATAHDEAPWCSAFVNWRRIERGERIVLALSYYI